METRENIPEELKIIYNYLIPVLANIALDYISHDVDDKIIIFDKHQRTEYVEYKVEFETPSYDPQTYKNNYDNIKLIPQDDKKSNIVIKNIVNQSNASFYRNYFGDQKITDVLKLYDGFHLDFIKNIPEYVKVLCLTSRYLLPREAMPHTIRYLILDMSTVSFQPNYIFVIPGNIEKLWILFDHNSSCKIQFPPTLEYLYVRRKYDTYYPKSSDFTLIIPKSVKTASIHNITNVSFHEGLHRLTYTNIKKFVSLNKMQTMYTTMGKCPLSVKHIDADKVSFCFESWHKLDSYKLKQDINGKDLGNKLPYALRAQSARKI